jgi:redox-regulated HSP33 family molecular chaperone
MVKMVEGNLPADVECECGAIIKRKRIFNSPIAFFWDCDNCGNEIFNALPYEIDDLAQIIVEDGINVQCPICWTKYGFDEAGIGHVVK